MNRKQFISNGATLAAAAAITTLPSCCQDSGDLKMGEIQHTVMFNLISAKGSDQTKKFMDDAQQILSSIGSVKNFRIYKQISIKTAFDYQFSMVFSNQADYDAYNNHPDHVAFVKNRWMKEVTSFQEADFTI